MKISGMLCDIAFVHVDVTVLSCLNFRVRRFPYTGYSPLAE